MGRNKNMTAAQKRRMDIITREVGCIPCRMEHGKYVQAQANHLLDGQGGYRIGHDAVVPECPWHHMGETLIGIDARTMRKTFGPSRKLNKKQFARHYGGDRVLLRWTNDYVASFEASTVGAVAR